MDELIRRLRNKGIGRHVMNLFLACLLYADDMCLIAPSRGAMQKMLDICVDFCDEFCLSFNIEQSKVMIFGNTKGKNVTPLTLYNEPLEFVPQWTYLDVYCCRIFLNFYVKKELSNFYHSLNSLLSSIQKPNELVLMNLLYSNCAPGLTHGAEVKIISRSELNDCNVALNNGIRRIFSYNRWESTRYLRHQLSFPSITEIFYSRSRKFLSMCLNGETQNDVIQHLAIYTKLENVEEWSPSL